MAKEFRAPVSMTFKIVDNGTVVGTVRIKPNAILWKPKGKHSWHGVDLDKFAKFAGRRGKRQKK